MRLRHVGHRVFADVAVPGLLNCIYHPITRYIGCASCGRKGLSGRKGAGNRRPILRNTLFFHVVRHRTTRITGRYGQNIQPLATRRDFSLFWNVYYPDLLIHHVLADQYAARYVAIREPRGRRLPGRRAMTIEKHGAESDLAGFLSPGRSFRQTEKRTYHAAVWRHFACPIQAVPECRNYSQTRHSRNAGYPTWTVIVVQAPRLIRSPSCSGICWLVGMSVPLSWVPLAEPGSRTAQPSGAAIRTACSRLTPGSVGGPVRSISGSRPREGLRRPMRISVPVSWNRRSGQYAGNGISTPSAG